ncbi:hypothetical protein Fmac_020086 [Flemingia macrophylla]|uniref:BHLH domain-containing protein n=1 Tax=Flemingia macrophylla TaxID=520843 RepID=A0ABD1M9M7_9FABA
MVIKALGSSCCWWCGKTNCSPWLPMEESWVLDMEMEYDWDVRDMWQRKVEEEFLRDILREPWESESQPLVSSDVGGGSPRTYILSFDKSTIIPATATATATAAQPSAAGVSKKRRVKLGNDEGLGNRGSRTRSGSQTLDHIMAERKRRHQLTQSFIALSAIIPGLKKTDKSSILGEAINYVKQLQERVRELEQRKNNREKKESMIVLKKTNLCANPGEDATSRSREGNEMLPDVEARVMENEVLIEIHCEKEHGVELKILDQLENLHLSVTATSIMPFGNSTLSITIIAQMGDAYGLTVNDLVKNLRQVLWTHMNMNMNMNTNPY